MQLVVTGQVHQQQGGYGEGGLTLDNHIAGVLDLRLLNFLDRDLEWPFIDHCTHFVRHFEQLCMARAATTVRVLDWNLGGSQSQPYANLIRR
jgi:hypothetical protein